MNKVTCINDYDVQSEIPRAVAQRFSVKSAEIGFNITTTGLGFTAPNLALHLKAVSSAVKPDILSQAINSVSLYIHLYRQGGRAKGFHRPSPIKNA